jgi:predicted N-formylglutamate amidohydrolase
VVPAILSVHSFTAHWRGFARPWHAGILWDRDPRLAVPLIDALRAGGNGLVIGDNEPYSGRLKGDCMYRHGTGRGLAHALVEIRQDLLGSAAGIGEWAERLAGCMASIAELGELREIRSFGSHSDGRATGGGGEAAFEKG